jgi:hypothetical protein
MSALPVAVSEAPYAPRKASAWLVSRGWDLFVFGGSAALAFLLLLLGRVTGALGGDTPPWAFLATVVFVDVAHVWATAYRVYLDPDERRRRPGLYTSIPVLSYVCGVLLYSVSGAFFWRVLAYVAVFHFVRQQYGWVALYRRRLGVASRLDRTLDDLAIYSATLYPLVYWHAHLPREFSWFIAGDFVPGLPAQAAAWLLPVHLAITAAYLGRQLFLVAAGRPVSWGKNLIVLTTWLTWYVGIVVFDSDYVFTVTNVLVHGIPYMAFVWVHGRARWRGRTDGLAPLFRPAAWPLYLAPLVLVAFSEEWLWDRMVWHDHPGLFPGPDLLPVPGALVLLVPLLAMPQATHYVLDAWIWKVRPENPELSRLVGP